MTQREKFVRRHGRLFDVEAKGFGDVIIREITPDLALMEVARRWGVDPEDIRDYTVREVST